MSAPLPVLLARLANILESARAENAVGNLARSYEELDKATSLLEVIRDGV